MTKISLYDIFTGSATTKWLESGDGISFDYSDDFHSVIVSLSGASIPVDISLDPHPTLGGDLNLDGHSIISNAGQDISITPGIGGNLILNGLVFPSSDGENGDLLGTDGAGNLVWYKVPGITNSQAGLTYYVDQSVSVTGDGSKENPFKTLPEALSASHTNDTIVIYSGTYSGDITFAHSLTLMAIDGANVRIFGRVSIPPTSTILAKNIIFENNADIAMLNVGSFELDGGSLVRDNSQGVINNGTMILKNVLINTQIASTDIIELFNTDSLRGLISTQNSLIIHSAIKAPMVDHQNGTVEIRNAPAIDFDPDNSSIGQGNSVKSTANSGILLIDTVSFKQSSGWSKIAKTGTCDWIINNVGRNPLQDVLNGNRQYFLSEASDLSSYYKPTNYFITTAVNEIRDIDEASITDHLIGIDAKIGAALSTPANAIWVAANGNNTNDGSINQPFASLAHAVAQALPSDTIIVSSGIFDGETIVVDKNLNIVGFETAVFTNSTMEISNGAALFMDHISFVVANDIPLTVMDGSFQIYNSSFETQAATAIQINQLSADSEIHDSNWTGQLNNADSSSHKLVVSGINLAQSKFKSSEATAKTYIRDSALIGTVEHDAGYISIINVGQIKADGSGKSLISTAPSALGNFLYLNIVSTKQDDGSYGIIDKTGNCDYQLGINDIGTGNTFTGTGIQGILTSDQINVTYTPTSYTATNVLTDHIEKIDQMLGDAVIKPSRLYYVDTIDGLNSIYSSITETTFGFDSTIYITPGAIAQFILESEFVPGINLIGTGSAENVIVQMPLPIPNLHITSAQSGMVHETLYRDIKLNSPVIVEQTLAGDEIHFENMTINGDITVNYGKMIIRNSRINGVLTISGGSVEIWNSELQERVIIGDGELYMNGVKHHISSSYPAFDITGGNIVIESIRSSNDQESIFKVQGGKTIVSSLIIDSNSYDTVIYQDIGGSIYIGSNNIAAEGKTVSGTVMNLGFGL